MKPLFYYFIQVMISSGLLSGYYFLFLRNKKFHQYNRYYLLIATIISILIPFLDIPVYFSQQESDPSLLVETLTAFSYNENIPVIHASTNQVKNVTSFFSWQNLILCLYLLVGLIVFIKLIIGLFHIRVLIRKYPMEKIGHILFVNTHEPGTPFSFFKWLFWNDKIDLQSGNGQQIFRHELFHIGEKHTRDIVFLEIVSIVFWLNPFFHLIKRELKAIHEFLADQFAVRENDKWNYAELLLMQVLQFPSHRLINPFFHNQVKRRIAMITSSKKTSHIYLRKLMVLPIAAIVIALFAFSYNKRTVPAMQDFSQVNNFNSTDTIKDPPKVVISTQLNPPKMKRPTAEMLRSWIDDRVYGVWVDDKRIENIELSKYTSSDFAYYYVSKLAKNAINYGKYYYQVDLSTNKYFEKKVSEWEKVFNRVATDSLPVNMNKYKDHLIVINGILQEQRELNKLDEIKPDNIRQINILKGPAAYTKYGERGQNGVIEIITKINNENKSIDIQKQNEYNLQQNKNIEKQNDIQKIEVNVHNEVNSKNQQQINQKQDAKVNIHNTDDDNKIFAKVEQEPTFPGGTPGWIDFLQKNLKSTVGLDNGAPAGSYTVKVQFIVDRDGDLSDFKTLTNNGYGMEAEILRVMKLSPRWNPGVQNGHIVKAYKMQPVTFVIEEEDEAEKNNKSQEPVIPTISRTELIRSTVTSLLQIEPSAEVKGFLFTIDDDSNDIIEVANQGNKFNEKTKILIQNAKAGKILTIDRIITIKNGEEKKHRSVIYKVRD